MKKVLVLIDNDYNDIELAYVSTYLNKAAEVEVKIVSASDPNIVSLGNLSVQTEGALVEEEVKDTDMIILIGGYSFARDDYQNENIKNVLETFKENGKSIAAIGEAVYFLGNMGLLNETDHTADSHDFLIELGEVYNDTGFTDSASESCNNIITAKSDAGLEFTRRVFELLDIDPAMLNA